MANVENLYNSNGDLMYPLTHQKAVIDDSGNPLDSVLTSINERVDSLGDDIEAASSDISKLETSIEAEVTRAQEAEQALSTEITEAENRVDERVTEVRDDLDAEVQARNVAVSDLNANTGISEYPAFSEMVDYTVGDVVVYDGLLKRFTAEHAAGEWIGTDVEKWSERKEREYKTIKLYGLRIPPVEEWTELAGKPFYNQEKKLIRVYDGNKWSTIPYVDGGIYICDNKLYVWDGEDLVATTEDLSLKIDKLRETSLFTDEIRNTYLSKVLKGHVEYRNISFIDGKYYYNSITGELVESLYNRVTEKIEIDNFVVKTAISGGVVNAVYYWRDDVYLGAMHAGFNATVKEFIITRSSYYKDATHVSFSCFHTRIDSFEYGVISNINQDRDLYKEIDELRDKLELDVFKIDDIVNDSDNTIFTIPNSGIRADESASDFGNVISFEGDNWKVSDFIPYKANTEITAALKGRYGSFGIVFYNSNKEPQKGYIYDKENSVMSFSYDSDGYFRASKPSNNVFTYYEVTDLKKQVNTNYIKTIELEKVTKKITEDISILNKWAGKTIYFCGTSIPQGGYPQIVCDLLGAKCVNEAVGASVLRKALRDGGGFIQFEPIDTDSNYTRAFTATKAEKQDLFGSSEYNDYSFEEKLVPYLDGTYDMPDLFVIDYSADDKKRSGKTDEYFAAINTDENALLPSDYPLAEDALTKDRGVQFNRNSYTGAANFIIDLIYQYNPQAKIMIMGFQNREKRPRMMDAQKVVADYWQIPYFPLSDYLGWSERIIYGSKDKFNEKYSGSYTADSDVSAMVYWCPDGIHPHTNYHTNELGYKESNYEIAVKVAEFLRKI